MAGEFEFRSNIGPVKDRFAQLKIQALIIAGQLIEGSINPLVPNGPTAGLLLSLTNKVKEAEDTVYIGVNEPYAIYVEFGTGIYAENGAGRKTPWFFEIEEGKWVRTVGQKPQSYMREGYARAKSNVEKQVKALFKTF